MQDENGFDQEPLDFSQGDIGRKCPYCGETLGSEELGDYLSEESNTIICPNCRKKINVSDLGTGI